MDVSHSMWLSSEVKPAFQTILFISVVLATDSVPDSLPTQNSGTAKTSLPPSSCEFFWSLLFPSLFKELRKSNTQYQGSLSPPNYFWTLNRQPSQSFPLSFAHGLTWTKLYTELSINSSQLAFLGRLRTWSAHGLSLICCGIKSSKILILIIRGALFASFLNHPIIKQIHQNFHGGVLPSFSGMLHKMKTYFTSKC